VRAAAGRLIWWEGLVGANVSSSGQVARELHNVRLSFPSEAVAAAAGLLYSVCRSCRRLFDYLLMSEAGHGAVAHELVLYILNVICGRRNGDGYAESKTCKTEARGYIVTN